MNYYIIDYKAGSPGCPLVLKGEINKDWTWDHLDPNPDQFEIDGNYNYKTKLRLIDFDFWDARVMASEAFVNLMEEMNGKIRKIPLKIIYPNKSESNKKYFYVLWKEWHSIIDLGKSKYEPLVDIHTGKESYCKDFPDVLFMRGIKKFALDANKDPQKHIFKSLDFFDKAVCSKEFMQTCLERKFKGLSFTPIEEAQYIDYLSQ